MRHLLTSTLALTVVLLTSSCENKEKAAREAAAIQEEERQRVLKRHAEAEKEHAEKLELERQRIERKQQLAARIKKLEEQHINATRKREAEAELLRAERKEAARLAACQKFIGTKFDTLTLTNDQVYNQVTVVKADAVGITIQHSAGARSIDYRFLPTNIQRSCRYDKEAAKKQVNADMRAARERQVQRQQQSKKRSTPKSTPSPQIAQPEPLTPPSSEKKPVTPRGYIKTRVISHDGGKKRLELRVYANVDCSVRSSRYGSYSTLQMVPANTKVTLYTYSDYKGRYHIQLVTPKGKQLDAVTNLRKKGLQGAPRN